MPGTYASPIPISDWRHGINVSATGLYNGRKQRCIAHHYFVKMITSQFPSFSKMVTPYSVRIGEDMASCWREAILIPGHWVVTAVMWAIQNISHTEFDSDYSSILITSSNLPTNHVPFILQRKATTPIYQHSANTDTRIHFPTPCKTLCIV